ncbi:bifunctional methylenetetrahydrofolate dehydrogenase/methenyltetrahydrofolate cyclohydrolase [Komagataeibacter nataicola]|uniref:Bifunctional protein FolD n=1 Tax=Komagataeibacter nataicola TaxID=265960 RepID=A0A9N7CBB1_9PROT|nr:bifunctional methylenetetrahydrofolate dehydrogenase/methenyltetrahydrofolate cyclohydrolase FolD [Komagataeibacter nataicola]AQU88708.1 bifunctional methylenetetrahydrofolate dehydrogenase/methenyltetrahydrofolate cyclohydrolase [Komagataeibacter nataicola]PYD66708.1 bifunctional methylenetetrahydrofolate dehydrogenase/methenyltetrahydrofolate cyclohydrolase [Komagataeibacter nataicola]WEQ57040.1 bifunctional methylenetetrahydrofolate dehydrogenase/methenyltetrahydrofolate cyclohydrolase Fol
MHNNSSSHRATLIDGRAEAAVLKGLVAHEVTRLQARGITPSLAVVLVGEDPASHIYVRNKIRAVEAVGMRSISYRLPAHTPQAELLELVSSLNTDAAVHGILVQLPLPAHIDRDVVTDAITPAKDVDGFHIDNAGKLAVGREDGMIPCTAVGCRLLLRRVLPDLAGLHAVIIGCSNIVGRPTARLLLNEGCTVVMTHLQSRDVAAEARRADILVVAAGHAGLVRGDWIKPGAVVIDVGINRVEQHDGARIVGDVEFDEAVLKAAAITPVPGGVGPMTIACLLWNTLCAAQGRGTGQLPRTESAG